MSFFTADILTCHTRRSTGVPVRHDSVAVSQHAESPPEPETAEWNSSNGHFIMYTCAFPTVTCPNIFPGRAQTSVSFQVVKSYHQNADFHMSLSFILKN